ncbi:MAG: hypothetical protein RSF82_03945 [Angelakisella sp.]
MNWLERVRTIFNDKEQAWAVKDDMKDQISRWGRLYRQGSLQGTGSLRLPAAIASELARLAVCELETRLTGGVRAEFLQQQYAEAVAALRGWAEYGFACGGMVLKVVPQEKSLRVECIGADCFTPLGYTDGQMTAAEFTETAYHQGRRYRRAERHRLQDGRYEITNTATDSSGRMVPLEQLPQWSDLAPSVVLEGVTRPLFVYFRTPMANSTQPQSPLGVSVYANAVELIAQAEEQWERIDWEYRGSELALDASEDLFEHRRDGSVVLPEGKERLFRAYDIDIGQSSGKFLEVFSPAIRDDSLFNGFNNILRRIEFNCGLAYGTLSDPHNVERTAEEIKAGKQRSYSTVCDLQRALERALRELAEVLDIWTTLTGCCEAGDYTAEFAWGDSIVSDSDTLRRSHREDVAAGLMTAQENRHIWYGKEG